MESWPKALTQMIAIGRVVGFASGTTRRDPSGRLKISALPAGTSNCMAITPLPPEVSMLRKPSAKRRAKSKIVHLTCAMPPVVGTTG